MPKSEKQFTKKDFENAFEKLILSISTKPTLFRNFIDLEGIRDGCARLVLFIEGCPEDEKSRLFSTLAEILLVSRLVHTTEMGRIFARKQRLAASRAREAKKTKSQSANEIISKNLRLLYKKNPARQKTDEGAAKDIIGQVNSDLSLQGLKPLGVSAVTKRIKAIRERTSG